MHVYASGVSLKLLKWLLVHHRGLLHAGLCCTAVRGSLAAGVGLVTLVRPKSESVATSFMVCVPGKAIQITLSQWISSIFSKFFAAAPGFPSGGYTLLQMSQVAGNPDEYYSSIRGFIVVLLLCMSVAHSRIHPEDLTGEARGRFGYPARELTTYTFPRSKKTCDGLGGSREGVCCRWANNAIIKWFAVDNVDHQPGYDMQYSTEDLAWDMNVAIKAWQPNLGTVSFSRVYGSANANLVVASVQTLTTVVACKLVNPAGINCR